MISRKFIATAPRQMVTSPNKTRFAYDVVDNDRLRCESSRAFPIINAMNAYIEENDQVELLIITANYERCHENFELMKKEAEAIASKRGANNITVRKIKVDFSEKSSDHLMDFEQLIENIHDGDRLSACITYGSKPTPLLEIMALNYGYKACKNVAIDCIVYGEMDHETGSKKIYDVTGLFYMDQIVNQLGQHGNKHTLSLIKSLLSD